MRIAATLSILLLVAPPAWSETAADYPFYGTWNCKAGAVKGAQGLSMTAEGYVGAEGQDRQPYLSIDEVAGDYLIELPGDWRFAIVDLKEDSFTWRSPITGDEQTCRRAE